MLFSGYNKTNFDIEKIFSTANELKYLNEIKSILNQEVDEPSETFIRFFTSQVYQGKATAKVIEQFRVIVKKSINQWLSDKVSNRLKSALEKESESDQEAAKDIEESIESDTKERKIETTQEEIDGYNIVKSILREKGEVSKILYKDNQNYFAVYYEKQTQPICRLHFNRAQKYLGVIDDSKKEERLPIESLDDIFRHGDKLLKTLDNYIE